MLAWTPETGWIRRIDSAGPSVPELGKLEGRLERGKYWYITSLLLTLHAVRMRSDQNSVMCHQYNRSTFSSEVVEAQTKKKATLRLSCAGSWTSTASISIS
jgi:hypothetical protein